MDHVAEIDDSGDLFRGDRIDDRLEDDSDVVTRFGVVGNRLPSRTGQDRTVLAIAPGDEPVKIAVHRGQMVEFRKALPAGLEFDTLGESVGFFKFNGEMAARISKTCSDYQSEGLLGAPHEEVLRDVLLAQPSEFACEDVSGLPWIEVDFPEDTERVIKEVLPEIRTDIDGF